MTRLKRIEEKRGRVRPSMHPTLLFSNFLKMRRSFLNFQTNIDMKNDWIQIAGFIPGRNDSQSALKFRLLN